MNAFIRHRNDKERSAILTSELDTKTKPKNEDHAEFVANRGDDLPQICKRIK